MAYGLWRFDQRVIDGAVNGVAASYAAQAVACAACKPALSRATP